MDRRTFLTGAGAVLLAAPLAAEGQQPSRVPLVGYLEYGTRASNREFVEALRQGLREQGYIEGKNIVIEYRFAEGREERLPALAAELVGLKVDLIVAPSRAIRDAMDATETIPIVFAGIADPVGYGLVQSLARPGGHVTGVSYLGIELNPKRLELLKEALPQLRRVAALANPTHNAYQRIVKELEAAAKGLGLRLHIVDVREPDALDGAFVAMTKEQVGAVIVLQHQMFFLQQARIAALALKSRLPSTYEARGFVQAGGFMSYAADPTDSYRHAAGQISKILHGAKPGDVPVEQPTKFELVINLKTAKALGLTIPPSLLGRADEVIQ